MGKFYFGVGQAKTSHVDGSQIVLARLPLPWLQASLNVKTYAGQILPEHEIVMQLASPRTVAAQLLPAVRAGLEAKAAQEYAGLEQKASQLKAGVDKLNETEASRARPFLDYAWDSGRVGGSLHGVRAKIQRNEQLTSPDIDDIASAAYGALKHHGTISAVKDDIRKYIKNGEPDVSLIAFLAKHIEAFAHLAEYNETLAKLQQGKSVAGTPSAPVDLSGLEKGLLQEMPFLRPPGAEFGDGSKEMDGGVKTSYFSLLCSMLGTEPAKYFPCRVTGILEGRAQSGLVAPLTLKPGQSIPEELKSSYLTTQKFAQLITVLDRTLAEVVTAFFWRDRQWWADKGIKTSDDELIRALLSNNPATNVLYPAERVAVPGNNGLSKAAAERIAECYKSGSLAKLAAEHIGISEQTFSQENLALLVNTLDQLMPLLPFDLYELIVTNDRIDRLAQIIETKKIDWIKQKNATVQHIAAVKKAAGLKQSLLNNFGYDSKKVPDLKDACIIKECMGWLGPSFSFIEGILLRKSTMLSPV